jgi:hypothetical protein
LTPADRLGIIFFRAAGTATGGRPAPTMGGKMSGTRGENGGAAGWEWR